MVDQYAYLNGRAVVLTENFEEFLRGVRAKEYAVVAKDAEDGWSVVTEFNEYLYVYTMPPVYRDGQLAQERYYFETKFEGFEDISPDRHYCTLTWEDAEREHARMVAFARQKASVALRNQKQKSVAEPPKSDWNSDLSEVVPTIRDRR